MNEKFAQPKGPVIGILRNGMSIQEQFDTMPSLRSISGATYSEKLANAVMLGISEITVPPVEENGGQPIDIGDVVIPYPLRLVGKGSQGINTDKGTVVRRAAGAQFIAHFSGESVSQRPMGGGLFNINLNGELNTAIGDLVKVTQWSYIKVKNCSIQNFSGWGIRLRDVMESDIDSNLFRRLGGPNGGGILFDDVSSSVRNNVNNLRIRNNTFALISGPWVGSTANSNPDLIWLVDNKFEYDGTPITSNPSNSYVLDFKQMARCFILNNGFTHFTPEHNNYGGILYTGSTAIGPIVFENNGMFACASAGVVDGGIVLSRNNYNNQGSYTSAISNFINNSQRVCKIGELLNYQSNGNISSGVMILPNFFKSMSELAGNTKNNTVFDSEGETGSVMSVPTATQVRQWPVPKMYLDGKTVLKVTVKAKGVSDAATSTIALQTGSTLIASRALTQGSWSNYVFYVKAAVLPSTLQLRNSGPSTIMVDGMVMEKVNYVDWDFAFAPGTIAAGAKFTSANQGYPDTAGTPLSSIGLPMFDSSSEGLQAWVECTSQSGSFKVVVKNDTASSIVSAITRCRIRVFIP